MRSSQAAGFAALIASLLLIASVGMSGASPGQKKKKSAPAKPAAGKADPAQIADGKKVYLAQGCKACHVVNNDSGGKTGPDLTKEGAKRKPDWLAAQTRNPKKFDPKSVMPAYGPDKIDDKHLKSLVAYLASLK